MNEMTFNLLFVAGIGAAIAIVFSVPRLISKSRGKKIIEQGTLLGLVHNPAVKVIPDHFRTEPFLLFSTSPVTAGEEVRPIPIKNALEGVLDGKSVLIGDFRMIIPREADIQETIVLLKHEALSLPRFALTPRKQKKERFTMRLRTALNEFVSGVTHRYQKIEELPIDGYTLKSPVADKNRVINLFQGKIGSYFANNQGFTVEGSRDMILCYRRDHLLSPAELGPFVQEVLLIADLFIKAMPC